MAGLTELLQLDLPARPAYVGIARSVVTAAAAGLDGLDGERLDDLRLAVSEACTAVVAGGDVDRVVVRCAHDDATLEVAIEDTGAGPAGQRLSDDDGLALHLLTALVDELVLDEGAEGNAIRLRLLLAPTPSDAPA
jgi:anti-sigma regulatory factor (Ser/Thr protein kinase)